MDEMQSLIGFIFSGLALIVIGLWLISFALRQLKKERSSKCFPVAIGEILTSEISEEVIEGKYGAQTAYEPKIVFTYSVSGKQYTSSTISQELPDIHEKRKISNIINRYPKGRQVTIYYNPSDPSEAFLEPAITEYSIVQLWLGIIFLVVGLACQYFFFAPFKHYFMGSFLNK